MDIEIKDHEILIWTDKAIAEKLGAKYMSGNKYKLPKTIEAVKDLYDFNPTKELGSLYIRMNRAKETLMNLKTQGPPFALYGLRPYQLQDMHFLSKLPHGAVFNEQRTGKTPTLLSLLRHRGFKRNLIVVPAGLKLNWEKECAKWLPGIKTFVIRGPKSQRKRAYLKISEQESFVMILSFDTLKAKDEMKDIFAGIGIHSFDSMTVDEAHNMRNRKSKRTEAIQEMGKYANHRYALTGTPSVRDGHDVFPILQFLYPMKFTSYWAFVERYFEMKKDFFSGGYKPGKPIRYKELQNMLAMMGTNRKRKEVMQWLPDKTYTTIPIELTPRQRKAYDMVLETFEIETKSGELIVDAPGVLAQVTRLRQICLSPRMLGMDKVPSAKEQFLVEWLQDNKDEPVIIFSQFTSYLKQLAEVIKDSPIYEKVVMIHGEMSGAEKQQAVDDFQQGKVRILLGNIKAAGVGFTLDKATTTIFLDKEWNPVDNAQAEDRMVPVSKERIHKMDVISLVAANTYDERINELLENKINITSIINNGGIQAIDRMLKEVKA